MNNRTIPTQINELNQEEIFVFGSNLSGYHAGGAARIAYEKFGATWECGEGISGKSYAIPTIGHGAREPLPLDEIKKHVDAFIAYAINTPECRFLVTPIGCGIAGFKASDIAPLFIKATHVENIWLPSEFWAELINAETH